MKRTSIFSLLLVLAMLTVSLFTGVLAETAAPAAEATEAPAAEATEAPAAEATEAPAAEATEAPAAEATEAPADTFSYDALSDDTVIVKVGEKIITKADIKEMYAYYVQMYSQYGMDFTQPEYQRTMVEFCANVAAQTEIMRQKGAELGFDQFTEEELKKFQDDAQAKYDETLKTYTSYMAKEGATEEENKASALAYLDEMGYTVDRLFENAKESEVLNRVNEYAVKDVTVTDEEVKASYDSGVEADKASFDADASAYDTAKSSGAIIHYVPEGLRNVKHILVKFDKAKELKEARAALEGMAADDAGRKEAEDKLAALMAEIEPKLDEIQARIDKGEDFQALIDEYGEDGGMKSGAATAETGYTVSAGNTKFVKEFVDGAMALEKVGDVSEPVLSDYGFHFIRYDADVPAGAVAFDTLKESINTKLLEDKKSAAFSAALDEWTKALTVTYTEF